VVVAKSREVRDLVTPLEGARRSAIALQHDDPGERRKRRSQLDDERKEGGKRKGGRLRRKDELILSFNVNRKVRIESRRDGSERAGVRC